MGWPSSAVLYVILVDGFFSFFYIHNEGAESQSGGALLIKTSYQRFATVAVFALLKFLSKEKTLKSFHDI